MRAGRPWRLFYRGRSSQMEKSSINAMGAFCKDLRMSTELGIDVVRRGVADSHGTSSVGFGERPSHRFGLGRDWRGVGAVLLLVVCTLGVYGRVCGHEFAGFDDQMTIHHNPRYSPPSG